MRQNFFDRISYSRYISDLQPRLHATQGPIIVGPCMNRDSCMTSAKDKISYHLINIDFSFLFVADLISSTTVAPEEKRNSTLQCK